MNFRIRIEIGIGLILVALALFAWSSGDAVAFLHLHYTAGWIRSAPEPQMARIMQVIACLSLIEGLLMVAPPAWLQAFEKTRHSNRN